jgi:hypothetical protein
MVSLSLFGFLFVYVLQRFQGHFPIESHALLDAAGASGCHVDA